MYSEGKVIKIVPVLGLAYLEEVGTGKVIGFCLDQLQGYAGESFREAGVIPGRIFYFEASEDGRLSFIAGEKAVTSARQAAAGAR